MCAEPIPQNRDEIINWIAAQLGDLSRRNRTLEQVVEEIGRSLFFKDRLVSLASFPMLVWVGVTSTRRVTPPLDFRSDDFKREVLNQIACRARYEDRLNKLIEADGRDPNNPQLRHPDKVSFLYAGGQIPESSLRHIYDARHLICRDQPPFDPEPA